MSVHALPATPTVPTGTRKLTFASCHSLEKDPTRRASPWRMLEHPWMTDMRTKRVNMARYLSQVWGWDNQGAAPPQA